MGTRLVRRGLALLLAAAIPALAQAQQDGEPTANASQLAAILGLTAKITQLRAKGGSVAPDPAANANRSHLQQQVLASIQAAALDVDSVLAEIANERAQLAELRYALQGRRDKTVNRLNSAALLAGSGLGAAVSATQFTALSSRTQNIGDAVGIGSGIASTMLTLLAVRKQAGPKASVGETPNMLAPLLGGTANALLSARYPDSVMGYLGSVPASGDKSSGTRLERLVEQWTYAGRLDANSSVERARKVEVVSTSMDRNVKVSIDELTDRIAMLTDVSGRVSLMKRDLAVLLRSCCSLD